MKIKIERTFFLIPGFRQKISDKDFLWLIKFLKENSFKILGVPVEWNYRTISDYVKDFEKFYNKHKSKINYVLGFSYGAVIAFLSANKLEPEKIYLCSLSPDFNEDLPKTRPWIRKLIGKRRIADVKKRSAKKIAKELKIPSTIFYGEIEGKNYPSLKIRCEETVKLASRSKLVVVRGAPHKISHPEYMKSIEEELRKIS